MTLVEDSPPTARMKRANLQLSASYEPPANDLELKLEAIWKESIAVDAVGRRDDFFELGGDSLAAERIALRIEALGGNRFSGSDLIEHSSIAALADLLAERSAPGAADDGLPDFLNVVQKGGSLPPLFCIHGGLGVISPGRKFFEALGPDRPVYLFQAPGMNGKREPLRSFEEFTTEYLAAIRKVQPHGPYNIMAYCSFCFVAFEIARRLADMGETVDKLILLDPIGMPPALCYRHGWVPENVYTFNNGLKLLGRPLLPLPKPERVAKPTHTQGPEWERQRQAFGDIFAQRRSKQIQDRMSRLTRSVDDGVLTGSPLFDPAKVQTTLASLDRAVAVYMPSGRYKGRAYLLRTEEFRSRYTKWWRLNVSDLRLFHIKGTHNGLWLANLGVMSRWIAKVMSGEIEAEAKGGRAGADVQSR